MSLQELKAAAEAALLPDTVREMVEQKGHPGRLFEFYKKANPATILKLIAVVEAVRALTDPENNLPCIPAGPERRELEETYRRIA